MILTHKYGEAGSANRSDREHGEECRSETGNTSRTPKLDNMKYEKTAGKYPEEKQVSGRRVRLKHYVSGRVGAEARAAGF